MDKQHLPLNTPSTEGPARGLSSEDLGEISFDDWLRLGVSLGYCTDQYCETHDGSPMHETEEIAWEAGWDPCVHVVRLGTPADWELDVTEILSGGGDV